MDNGDGLIRHHTMRVPRESRLTQRIPGSCSMRRIWGVALVGYETTIVPYWHNC